MSSLDADINIILNAKDNASDVVSGAARRINSSYRDMRRQQNAVGQVFELNNRRLFQTMRGIQTVGNVANRMVGIYQAWNIQQIRNADLARDLAEAQRNVNRAMIEGGPGSEELTKAMEEEARIKEDISRANFDTAFSYVFMATSITGSLIPALKKAIPFLSTHNRLTKGIGIVGGAALIGAGLATGGNPNATFNEKLMSTLETAGGGALLGATIGSVVPGIGTAIGAGVGGGIGAGVGIAQNFGGEIQQFFTFNAPTSQELVNQVANAARQNATFGGQ